MSAQDNLSPLQFEHSDQNGTGHVLDAYHDGQHIGRLFWSMKSDHTDAGYEPPGHIQGVMVAPEQRRKGVATAMLNEGRKYAPRPRHSGSRTPDGDAWAGATAKRPKKNQDTTVRMPDSVWQYEKQPDRPYQGRLF
jgi:GNAT superfamily N-acetyltransferase